MRCEVLFEIRTRGRAEPERELGEKEGEKVQEDGQASRGMKQGTFCDISILPK